MCTGWSLEQIEAMPARHFALYRALQETEPFGPVRDNIHAANIAALIFNSSRGKAQAPATVMDFMLEDPESKKQRQSAQVFGSLLAASKPRKN